MGLRVNPRFWLWLAVILVVGMFIPGPIDELVLGVTAYFLTGRR